MAQANPIANVRFAQPAAERMAKVAHDVATKFADAVDHDGRFPTETFAALKAAGLLSVTIPREHGGEGLSLGEVASLIAELGQACGSSSLIYAMHYIKLSSLVAHHDGSAWLTEFMRRVARDQLLLGSATTEAGIGGDLRNSICAVEVADGWFDLTKDASVISYARDCDAILVTARRAADAPSSDQVMVVVEKGQYTLDQQTLGWDTLGMRGTCSEGFKLVCRAPAEQIFPQPFAEIAAQSMLATTHCLWSATWFGIAAGAVGKAQAFVKAEARKRPGAVPPGALRLAEATDMLTRLKSVVVSGIHRFEAAKAADGLLGVGFAAEMNTVKTAAASLSVDVVRHALLITGLPGYRNDTPFSVGRAMRDALSGAIMISNDRILGNTSNLLLVGKLDTNLAI
ncbi:MAG: acyl-CoA/acyl-ACP dehydrogenase [Hyphomicrobiaceae bacterium]|nr:acyl-CoA/acyl-ACP dehydrogenase [Hyphomicrobiaceae bacterium]